MQYTEIFKVLKNENFQKKIFDIFLVLAQNIDCGYMLEPPHLNEDPQSMFWSKKIRKISIPLHTPVLLYKRGLKGVYISQTCFPDASFEADRDTT